MDTDSSNSPHQKELFSAQIHMDADLANISCAAIEELCTLCGILRPEGIVENPVLSQLHNALILMRAGILKIERSKNDNCTVALMLTISNKGY